MTSSGLVTTSAMCGRVPDSIALDHVVHDPEVLAQDVEATLTRGGVGAGREDEDVLVPDVVEPATLDLDAGQQGPGVLEVQRQSPRGLRLAAVDRDATGEPPMDERGHGGDPDSSGSDDPDARSRHVRRSLTVEQPQSRRRTGRSAPAWGSSRRPGRASGGGAWSRLRTPTNFSP